MSVVVHGLYEIARHFGKSYRTAQRWKRAGMPRLAGNRFDLEQVEAWLKSARYLGASFRQLESEELVKTLFESAVVHLRRGLQHLCRAFVSARGRNRTLLIDEAIKGILVETMRQESLLREEGGDPRPQDLAGKEGEQWGTVNC